MGRIRQVALAVLGISFVVFIALFGRLPAFRKTPIGLLHRTIWIHIPQTFKNIDRRLTGGRFSLTISRLINYIFNEKHPIVLILFLLLLTAAAGIFLDSSWYILPLFPHRFPIIPVLLPLPYLFTYLCNRTPPSFHITEENLRYNLSLYPFDRTIFFPKTICSTCRFEKPARSKHCPICKHCIARHDHHCVWVNNCIGRQNYRWFLCLVASLSVLLSYGAYLAFRILATQRPRFGRRGGMRQWLEGWSSAITRHISIGGPGLLALLTAPLAWGFLVYHVYLLWAGMTTNETVKWGYLRDMIADDIVFKGKRNGSEDDAEGEHGGFFAGEKWPLQSTQIIVMTEDGEPPEVDEGEEEWVRCRDLSMIDNVYDLGFWGNLKDAFSVD